MSDDEMIELEIDGRAVRVPRGTTLWDAAQVVGCDIPVLCHDPRLAPVGVCRICVVDVGERVLAAACVRECEPGMQVKTVSDEIERHRKQLTELLMADQPAVSDDAREQALGDGALRALARHYDADGSSLPAARPARHARDASSAVIAVDHAACILCDRCIRACDELQNNEVLGRTGKGYAAGIAFDLDTPMGESTCVSCGECAAVCPTGALVDKPLAGALQPRAELEAVDSTCPYCGVGCALTYHVEREANRIVFAEGRESPGSQQRLCVKGRYGWDYASHPQRLRVPLIRRESAYPKGALSRDVREKEHRRRKPGGLVDYDEVLPAFREASWDEALEVVASRLAGIRDDHGPSALAGFGSAKCSNEEAYLFQKLVRTAFGTNNVDHCTRLCHASSVAALLEGIGSAAVTTTYGDIANAGCALIAGSNTTANHPVAATFFKQARKAGTQLIVVDPRRADIADHADWYCRIKPGTDVAFYNAMMHVIIEAGLADRDYIERHTEGYEALRELVVDYPPERAASICGVDAETLREVALAFARADQAIIFWGMGISQHVYGTNNARCLIALALLTGNIGKPGSGLHPLRGQNNVQGASDSGLIPMVYPDYQAVGDPETREKFERAWGRELDPNPGLTVVEIVHSALEGRINGMYIMGENPFLSDPNVNKVRRALANLDFLVVQDIFLTETAEFADVILPASSYLEKLGTYTNTDRRVQIGRPVLRLPGEARFDWEILCDVATRMGYPMQYGSPSEIFDEFAALTSAYHTFTYDNLGATGKLWPNPDPEHDDGPVVLFSEGFPTANGRAKFVPAEWTAAPELPDADYPLVLNTGRLLEHWHTGSMTRRARALDAIEPAAQLYLHPDDARERGISEGDEVRIASRRGSVCCTAQLSTRDQQGAVFLPFHFREAAANLLTLDELDPDGKIPGFKFCAVEVERIAD
ncbi:MAG: formate dehydrogenase subunit alpha [Myxococcota bacterium]|nr:formate dehydrogenase subunit alpha [Myxococcota bacterium]